MMGKSGKVSKMKSCSTIKGEDDHDDDDSKWRDEGMV